MGTPCTQCASPSCIPLAKYKQHHHHHAVAEWPPQPTLTTTSYKSPREMHSDCWPAPPSTSTSPTAHDAVRTKARVAQRNRRCSQTHSPERSQPAHEQDLADRRTIGCVSANAQNRIHHRQHAGTYLILVIHAAAKRSCNHTPSGTRRLEESRLRGPESAFSSSLHNAITSFNNGHSHDHAHVHALNKNARRSNQNGHAQSYHSRARAAHQNRHRNTHTNKRTKHHNTTITITGPHVNNHQRNQ